MDTPQPICMVQDKKEVRPLRNEEQNRVSGFLLCGEGYGDMICMIPTVEKTARQLNRPLDVWSKRPEVFANIPTLKPRKIDDAVLQPYLNEGRLLIVCPVQFNGLPDRNQTHIVAQPAQGIVQLEDTEKEVRLYTTQADRETATRLLEPLGSSTKVVIHPNRSWTIRTWPEENWRHLARSLLELGVSVVTVGCDVQGMGQQPFKGIFDLCTEHDRLLNLVDQTSLHELVEVITLCDLVITVDSGVLHVANCTDTNIVAIFTDIDPRFRTRIRQGKPNAETTIVGALCDKQYCQSWHSSTGNCLYSDEKEMCCLPSVKQVLNAAISHLGRPPV